MSPQYEFEVRLRGEPVKTVRGSFLDSAYDDAKRAAILLTRDGDVTIYEVTKRFMLSLPHVPERTP